MPRLVRLAVAFVLVVALATPALAAPLAGAEPRPGLLVSLWNLLTGLWNDNGCSADPSGAALNNGCEVDPSGRCIG